MESLIENYEHLPIRIGTFPEGETVLMLGGFTAHQGYLALPWIIFAVFFSLVQDDPLNLSRKFDDVLC